MNAAKIRHYGKLLNMEFNSAKNVCKVLNNICDRKAKGDSNINNISCNGISVINKTDMANLFNNYFCNIGKQLGLQNNQTGICTNFQYYLKNSKSKSFYLSTVMNQRY